MNTKKTLISLILLVLILIGAYFLYGYLSEEYSTDKISIIEEQGTTTKTDSSNVPEKDESSETDENKNNSPKTYAAPDFTVSDGESSKVSLSSKFGKPIVVNFWASWCPPCKSEMPDFEEAYKKYGEDVHFMMVNMTGGRETVASAKAFIENSGYTFPVYYDLEYDAATTYGASSIPMTFFIDKNGNLAAYARGMIDSANLEEGIRMIYENTTDIG